MGGKSRVWWAELHYNLGEPWTFERKVQRRSIVDQIPSEMMLHLLSELFMLYFTHVTPQLNGHYPAKCLDSSDIYSSRMILLRTAPGDVAVSTSRALDCMHIRLGKVNFVSCW